MAAEIKKYLDNVALGTLVDQIKAEDAKALKAAKDYADGLAKNYDAAGSAATAESNAKAYTDALANGAVKTNTEAIAVLNGTGEGSVKKAVADVKGELEGKISGVEGKVDKNAEDIASITNAESGILAQAKAYADAEDAKVEQLVSGVSGDLAELEGYVGTFTHDTAKTVVEYIDAKTTGIASDAVVSALGDRVTQAEKDIDAIEADYLKSADKTELSNAIAAEKSRAEGIEGGLETRLAAVEADYLKGADKTELNGKIDLKADKTALEAEVERAQGAEKGLQDQIDLIMNNPDTKDVIDSIAEFTQYISEHGEIAEGFRTDIDQNKEDIAAEVKRAGEAEAALSGRMDAHEAIDHDFAAADASLKSELEGKIALKADASALEAAVEALEGVDADFEERITAMEGQLGDGEGSVADMIATAKQEAIEAASKDAADKDVVVLSEAQKYADAEDAKIEARVDALETASATHALKTEVEAVAGRVTTVEGKVTTLEGEMDAVEALAAANKAAHEANAAAIALKASQADLETAIGRIAANEGAISGLTETMGTKADQDDLDAAVLRIAANESAIAANTSAINSFVAITPEEIVGLFA